MNPETPITPPKPRGISFPTGKRELIYGLLIALCGFGLCNSMLFGGFSLGFAIFGGLSTLLTAVYLFCCREKPTVYSILILALCLAITAAFGRSSDGLVKFVMVLFLLFGNNLGLCLLTRRNRRDPGRFHSLWDAPTTFFTLGFGKLPHAVGGLFHAIRNGGAAGRKGWSFILGLCVALPLAAIVVTLLSRADAAFSGLLSKLPDFRFWELFITVLLGIFLVLLFYVRGVALHHAPRRETAPPRQRKKLNPITVNTVLCAIGAVYLLYLVSQLAYFVGGFAGILPEGYSTAEYARRGFFEMAALCGINLAIIALATFLVRQKKSLPVLTKLLCLFIGLTTLFLVVSASAKMYLYIGTYGLTRLRVLTQIIMLFLAMVNLVVMVWLFVPKLPYMKFVVITALLLGAVTVWVDVDTLVATYNTEAYLSGQMETVDVQYLSTLGSGAVPSLHRIYREATDDVHVRLDAKDALYALCQDLDPIKDFRRWNYADAIAEKHLTPPPGDTPA